MNRVELPFIDLRSDTVTCPTDEMRRAMAEAQVGDDVFGDDPTVARLEETAAALLGKEAALFFPSGTMANLAALMAHAIPGGEVYLGAESHIYYYEAGGVARIAGLLPRLFSDHDGMPHPDDIRALLRPANVHFPTPGLLCLENTHNRAGGTVATAEQTAAAAAVAREAGVPVHLDGARLFNAAAALSTDVHTLAAPVDSVMVSLSKALSAPVGSLLAGEAPFIATARTIRKLLGGGMRQVGVIAAAGLVALETLHTAPEALHDQHAVAKALAEELGAIDGISIEPAAVQTNIVLFRLAAERGQSERAEQSGQSRRSRRWEQSGGSAGGDADAFVRRLADFGVGAVAMDLDEVRFVTHRHVTMAAVPRVAAAVQAAL